MSQPRYAEFIRLKTITERWEDFETVDGNDLSEPDNYNGGGANG